MPGHFGGSHSHGDKSNKSSDRGHSRFSSGSGYYGGTTKTKTTSQGSDDKKINYQTSTQAKANAKKAAAISKRNKMKKDMEDFANYTYEKPTGLAKFSPVSQLLDVTGIGKKTFEVNKEYYSKNVIGKTNPKTGEAYAGTIDDFKGYMSGRTSGELDAMGRTINRDNDGGRSDTGGRVVIEKKVGGSTILTETKTEAASLASQQFGIEPVTVLSRERGAFRDEDIFLGCAFTCGLEKVVVPFFDRGTPVEYELIRSICTVAEQKRKRLGVVATDADLFGGFDMASGQQRPAPRDKGRAGSPPSSRPRFPG